MARIIVWSNPDALFLTAHGIGGNLCIVGEHAAASVSPASTSQTPINGRKFARGHSFSMAVLTSFVDLLNTRFLRRHKQEEIVAAKPPDQIAVFLFHIEQD